jgi:hypothetical protein
MKRVAYKVLALLGYLSWIVAFVILATTESPKLTQPTTSARLFLFSLAAGFLLVSVPAWFDPVALVPPLPLLRRLIPIPEGIEIVKLFGKAGAIFGLLVGVFLLMALLASFLIG